LRLRRFAQEKFWRKSPFLLMKNHCLPMKNLNLLMRSHHHLLPHRQSPLHCMALHRQAHLLQDHLHHHLLIFLHQEREQEGNRNQDDQHQKDSAENQRYLWNKALLLHLEMGAEMEMGEEVKKVQMDLLEELEA